MMCDDPQAYAAADYPEPDLLTEIEVPHHAESFHGDVDTVPMDDSSIDDCASEAYDLQHEEDTSFTMVQDDFPRLPHEQFHDTEDAIQMIMKATSPLPQVPRGTKENVFFIVDNTQNTARRQNGKKARLWDDCGAYVDGGSGSKFHYLYRKEEKPCLLYVHKGQYCRRERKKKVSSFFPLQPQPAQEELLVVERKYDKLKLDPSYKRRVTTIHQLPGSQADLQRCLDVALFEYTGSFPGHTAHGRTKSNSSFYQRTEPATMDSMTSLLSDNVPPRDVYWVTNRDQDGMCAPRDTKQIRNMKYRQTKKDRGDAATDNFADQIMYVTSLLPQGDSFVQSVVFDSNKVPTILLYTEMQVELLRQACCSSRNQNVLGVDRTYSLGEVYVTVTLFKHPGLRRRTTNEEPILIGPMILHGTCTHTVYAQLFNKFATAFSAVELKRLVIGSDEEHALRKAIRKVLPNTVNVICERHVRKNVVHQLQDSVGLNEADRRRVMREIFGINGLVNAASDEIFNQKLQEIKELVMQLSGKDVFSKYVDSTLADVIRFGIIEPVRCGYVNSGWTNNNCESTNHVLKSALNWKTQKLPVLVEELRRVVITVEKDIERAIYGSGNYYIAECMRHYEVSPTDWSQLPRPVQQRKVQDFVKDRRKKKTASNPEMGSFMF